MLFDVKRKSLSGSGRGGGEVVRGRLDQEDGTVTVETDWSPPHR